MKHNILYSLVAFLMLTSFCAPQTEYVHPVPSTIDENVILPPAWSFGVLYGGYTNQEQTIERINEIQERDYPIDAYWIDSWFWSFADEGDGPDKYLDFIADTIDFPNRPEMWEFMTQNNIKGGFWVWDAIQKTGNEEAFADFESRGYFRDTYMNTNSWHNSGTSTAMFQEGGNKEGTLTGNIDFDNPEAAAYFKQQMKHFFDEGADFIKLDRTTHLPTVRTIFEMSQEFGLETEGRGFMLSHAGGLEDPEFKRYPTKWTSDTRSDWTIDDPNLDFNSWVPHVAFKENIEKYTDPDNPAHTVPFLTNDTGGFDMGLTDEANEELYIRWLQFSMLSPITEVFSQPENPTSNMAYKYSDRADEIFREFSHLRMQLFPYIYSYAHKTRLEGENMMKLFDGRLYQYGFGNELLVAPIYEEGATSRNVFLPEGTWYNYWDGTNIEGNQEIEADAPIHRIPVFAKAGSIIPMREYAPSIETGTNEVLSLHVYPGTNGSFTIIEDDGTSNDYLEGKYATTDILLTDNESSLELAINPRVGSYNGMFSSRTWEIVIHSPFSNSLTVNVNGEPQEFSIENGTLLIDPFTNDLKEEINLVVQFN